MQLKVDLGIERKVRCDVEPRCDVESKPVEPPAAAQEDALTAAALFSAAGPRIDPSTPEARTIAARLVHRDWRLARARDAQSRRPDHWRLCWQPEL